MTRRKVNDSDKLVRKISIRVSDPFYKKMEGWLEGSNCQSMAELAKMILYREQIIWYVKDVSSDQVAIELTAIRKELNAIGTNINQVTRHFNGTGVHQQKMYEALKLLDDYKTVSEKVEKVWLVISSLTKHGS